MERNLMKTSVGGGGKQRGSEREGNGGSERELTVGAGGGLKG